MSFVLNCREEESILWQISEDVTLRMLRRVDDQLLLIGVKVDFNDYLTLGSAVVDN